MGAGPVTRALPHVHGDTETISPIRMWFAEYRRRTKGSECFEGDFHRALFDG